MALSKKDYDTLTEWLDRQQVYHEARPYWDDFYQHLGALEMIAQCRQKLKEVGWE